MVKLLHCLENPRELHMIERDDEEEGEEMDEEMIKMMMEQVRTIAQSPNRRIAEISSRKGLGRDWEGHREGVRTDRERDDG